jgi:MoaA/NifB/PqqE/SkfB family radical SAM enzyme
MNIAAFLNTLTTSAHTLPLVILYVTEGCNLRCITCSYRNPLPGELTLEEINSLARRLKEFGLRHVVYSGGEPLMRRDFPAICEMVGALGVNQTLLTNGLLLERRLEEVRGRFKEIIVSVDGPRADVHDSIRGVESFERIVRGIRAALASADRCPVSIRTVVQKRNFHTLEAMIDLAEELGVTRISFLAADVLSASFGRDSRGPVVANDAIMLSPDEAGEFRQLVERLVREKQRAFLSGFISESPGRMLHLVQYFEALANGSPFPATLCNAPNVSAVITSTGDIQPCFFLPPYGNVRSSPPDVLFNTPDIRRTRRQVRANSLDRCKTCVCTLHVHPHAALFDRF